MRLVSCIPTRDIALTFLGASLGLILSVCADDEASVMYSLRNAYPDWQPRGIVDVGANRGGWTTLVQEEIYPGIKTFMVEASPFHTGALEETKKKFEKFVDFEIAVLTESDGKEINFFDNTAFNGSGGTGNSIFQEKSVHYEGLKPEVRTTMKLDTLLKTNNMDYVDYLKLDVQGAELMVLGGATETLKKATFVQLEVSVIQYNAGAACWYDIDAFLRKHGFYFYDSGDYSSNEDAFHTKAIGQFDVLYIKPTSAFMPTWLVDNNVEFCGSSKGKNQDAKEISSVVLNTASTSNMSKTMTLYFLFIAFLCGFVVGKMTKNSKVKGVVRHRSNKVVQMQHQQQY